ncbi:MAG: hypothetical protein IJK74_02180 [Bacteroidales bacterium]|nr:hypothetical protein [Bacteroidales bacterium]
MKAAVFYYTQSGQALDAAKSICGQMDAVYKRIMPCQPYPFPWSRKEFFQVFPECRLALPPSGIEPVDFSDVMDADVVLVVGQSWFLSPSLPLQSFLSDENVKNYLKGRNVVFVNVCRNMWLKTSQKIKEYMEEAQARLVGHIVLQDNAANLVSAVTIIRWLIHGKKEATRILPAAGVSGEDIKGASRFGNVIENALKEGDLSGLQSALLAEGAIKYKPSILAIEKTGHRIFGFWAKFVRKKGGFGDNRRQGRLTLFYYYLLFVLFALSPLGQLFFWATYPLRRVKHNRQIDCNV